MWLETEGNETNGRATTSGRQGMKYERAVEDMYEQLA